MDLGCKKERTFVSSFGCSKGWIFGLGVAALGFWGFGFSMAGCVCYVLCNACEVLIRVKSSYEHSTHSGGSRRRLLVEPWSFSHGSGVGGLC